MSCHCYRFLLLLAVPWVDVCYVIVALSGHILLLFDFDIANFIPSFPDMVRFAPSSPD